MTMNASALTITASEFKAKCLALMDQVLRTGEAIVITKNGRPVAQLTPPPSVAVLRAEVFGLHRGRVRAVGAVDLDQPVLDAAAWTTDLDTASTPT